MADQGALGSVGFALFNDVLGSNLFTSLPQVRQLVLPSLTDSAKTAATGTQIDDKFGVQLFGKDIPIFVGGEALMGCRIIEGPFVYTDSLANLVDIIVSPAIAASPTATRTITSLNLNGTQSATSSDGGVTWSPIGSSFSGLEISIKTGTETQTPFASSISRYGSRAVAYRSHICVEIKRIPLDVFNNQIPFVSAFVHEANNITRNDALTALARYARYDDTEFEFDVLGADSFWIVAQQNTFIDYLKQFQQIFRTWNISANDKLRVFENTSGIADLTLTRSGSLANSIKLSRQSPLSLERQLSYSFIDTDRDNDINTVSAIRERFPTSLTSSESSSTVELPIGTTASAAVADVNRAMLINEIARTKLTSDLKFAQYGVELGDFASFSDDTDITFIGRSTSLARRMSDYAVEAEFEKIVYSTLNIAPRITSNGGGSTASITINENTTSVTTVTAADANSDALSYSIVGGADSAKFSINSSTGALSFLSAPDYEAPTDANADNVYEVTVQASDGSLTDSQAISVTVANVAEGGGSPMGLLLTITYP